jgi:indolepyruvate ferredoxin oxidoreductase alpha subunit
MNRPDFADEESGKKIVMLGNEAIARGILEAGVVIGAGYPGTPSSEILPTLAEMDTILGDSPNFSRNAEILPTS